MARDGLTGFLQVEPNIMRDITAGNGRTVFRAVPGSRPRDPHAREQIDRGTEITSVKLDHAAVLLKHGQGGDFGGGADEHPMNASSATTWSLRVARVAGGLGGAPGGRASGDVAEPRAPSVVDAQQTLVHESPQFDWAS